jgi:hypothetical protein
MTMAREKSQTHPLLARLARPGRWPSFQTTVRLFVAAFLVGVAGAVALLFVNPIFGTALEQLAARVIALSGLAVALLSPPVAVVVTVITTAADVRSEAYQLMRVSLLPKEEILSGYIYAALYRLRLLWVLAFGLLAPPTAVVTTAYWLWERPIFVAVVALAVWVNGTAMGLSANWLAVCIAVWQALRKKRIETTIITTLALLSVTGLFMPLAVSLVLGCAYYTLFYESGVAVTLACGSPFFLALMGYVIPRLTGMIREKAGGCI